MEISRLKESEEERKKKKIKKKFTKTERSTDFVGRP